MEDLVSLLVSIDQKTLKLPTVIIQALFNSFTDCVMCHMLCCSCLLSCSLSLQKSEIYMSLFWNGCMIITQQHFHVKYCCVRTTEHMKPLYK
jgi:hypothetical protein